MVKVVGSRGSRIGRVLWMLEELGEDYDIAPAKPGSPEARALNPTGRVPILVDGDLVLTDSAAICVYLGEKHPERGLAAASLAERARMDAWMHFIQSELEAPMWNKLKHRLLLPEHLRVDVGPWVAYEFARDAEALAKRLGSSVFALGGRFTAVDVVLGHVLQWAKSAKFEPFPANVAAYAERVWSRPALARAREREAAM
ncbi:MAG: glutathione S-transferase family protein [Phyllobacteriaceae bacterium]|nr:glutathione S-transferase family protein [Phyllobacteriaceae bacterium]